MQASWKVMVVDDSTIMRRVIGETLREMNELEICAQAKDGQDALQQLRTSRPDLILLDIEMPRMDGLEFLRHAKLKTRAKIIVLSSVTDFGSDAAVEALRRGADAIISKPSGAISLDLNNACHDQLRNAIKQVLDRTGH